MESIELLNNRLRGEIAYTQYNNYIQHAQEWYTSMNNNVCLVGRVSAEPSGSISAHEYETVDSGLNTNSNNGSYTVSVSYMMKPRINSVLCTRAFCIYHRMTIFLFNSRAVEPETGL